LNGINIEYKILASNEYGFDKLNEKDDWIILFINSLNTY
jgi:hypothetical protein